MRSLFPPRSSSTAQASFLKALVVLLAFVIAVANIAFEVWTSSQARDGQLAETQTKVANLSSLVAEHAERSIEAADIVIRGLVDQLETSGLEQGVLDQQEIWLARRGAELSQVAEFMVVDAAGRVVISSVSAATAAPVLNSEYFRFHRDHPNAGLHIAGPVPGRARGRSVFVASRSFRDSDGKFGGLVVGMLHTQFYQDFYERLATGKQGVIMLAVDDGTILVRHPYAAEVVGANLAKVHPVFTDLVPRSPAAGMRAVSPIDGIERWNAFRRLLTSNLLVVAALSEHEELATWRSQTIDQTIAISAILLIIGGFSAYLVREIGQRAEAEQAAAASGAQYKLLADNSTDVILRIGFDRTRKYVSPSARLVLGYEPEELLGQQAGELTDPDDRKLVHVAWERIRHGGRTEVLTSRVRHKAGHHIWVETTVSGIQDPNTGETVEMVASMREISTRKAIEASLVEAVRELSTARDAAEAATRAKSQFLAAMSHEIRTPLNAVIGFAELMQKTAPTDVFRGYAELQLEAGTALLGIINDILDLSKLEAGKLEILPDSVDLSALIESCVNGFRRSAREKGLDLMSFVAADLPPRATIDGKRLRQIISNLLSNAVKFTRAGRVSIEVRRGGTTDSPRLLIAVADTGIGIPEDKLGLLFQRFSQVDGSIDREFGGTGLGLAISQFLARLMQGDITVGSRVGVGSTFLLDLPLCAAESGQIEVAPRPPRETEKPLGVQVLVAEDDRANQRLITAILADAGCAVEVVSSGEAVVSAVQERRYDIVLMDIGMPGMDGMQATRRIRSLPGQPGSVPIVALTAHVLPGDAEQCIAAGMQAHVGKPINRRELLAVIATHTKTTIAA